MARPDYTFVKEGNVTIRYAQDVSGSPGTYVALGCPKGDWIVNRSTNMESDGIDNWCDTVLGELEQVSPSTKTITISGTMEMILSDAAFDDIDTDEQANNVGYLRITATDAAGATTRDKAYKGYWNNMTEAYKGSGPSDVPLNFTVIARQAIA